MSNNNINGITEMDKFITEYFRDGNPVVIDDKVVPVSFMIGTPDTNATTQFLTDTGDIAYPILIVSRNVSGSFTLLHERNAPHHDRTKITLRRFAKDKYINSDENNINVEIYTYNSPMFFKCQYDITFFCEYMSHASDFQNQVLGRLNQKYLPIQSERFKSVYFDLLGKFDSGFSEQNDASQASESKREIKVSCPIDGEGYFLSLDSQKVIRGISSLAIKQRL